MTTKTVADLSVLTGANTDVADLFLIWDTSALVHKYITRAELFKMPQTWAVDMLFTDATYDIGKSGATRPRDGFFSRNVAIGGTLGVTGITTLSAALGVGTTPSSFGHFRKDQNTLTDVVVQNATAGGSAAARLGLIGGTANSTIYLQLLENNGTPVAILTAGAAVYGVFYEAALHQFFTGDVVPGSDNTQKLGGASFRWSTVYAGTGAINTSGRVAKRNVRKRLDAEARVARSIKALGCFWQFADAVEAKGPDKARFHFGFIAEDIRDAFIAEGLDPHRYAMFCEDELVDSETYTVKATREKAEEVEEVERVVGVVEGKPVLTETKVLRKRPVGEWRPVLSESGVVIMAATPETDDKGATILAPMLHFVPEMEEYEAEATREVKTGEKRLGLRYDQLTLFVLLAGG